MTSSVSRGLSFPSIYSSGPWASTRSLLWPHFLRWILRSCKELYNASVEGCREAYCMASVSVSYQMQADQLPAIKEERPEYQEIFSQVLQDVLKRHDKAMQNFFRWVREGQTPGYPSLLQTSCNVLSIFADNPLCLCNHWCSKRAY